MPLAYPHCTERMVLQQDKQVIPHFVLLSQFNMAYTCLISGVLFKTCSEDGITHFHTGFSVSTQLPRNGELRSKLPAQHHFEVRGFGSTLSCRKLVGLRKIKTKHNHVGHDFKFPNSGFWNIALCSEHSSHRLQLQLRKFITPTSPASRIKAI